MTALLQLLRSTIRVGAAIGAFLGHLLPWALLWWDWVRHSSRNPPQN